MVSDFRGTRRVHLKDITDCHLSRSWMKLAMKNKLNVTWKSLLLFFHLAISLSGVPILNGDQLNLHLAQWSSANSTISYQRVWRRNSIPVELEFNRNPPSEFPLINPLLDVVKTKPQSTCMDQHWAVNGVLYLFFICIRWTWLTQLAKAWFTQRTTLGCTVFPCVPFLITSASRLLSKWSTQVFKLVPLIR